MNPLDLSPSTTPTTCFTAQPLNPTTFLIIEDDKWREHPFIYLKIHPSAIILLDTGCGGASLDPTVELKSLRIFIETYPVPANGGAPLNPNGEKGYVVICTHCHYDHIGGIEQFADSSNSSVWASGYDIPFVSDPDLLPIHSLCKFVGMETPHLKVRHWANDGEKVTFDGEDGPVDLALVIYQTPGHTPDELAVWDGKERVLFVGDSAYEWAPIIFPVEGSVEAYKESLGKVLGFVREMNADDGGVGRVDNTVAMKTKEFKRVSLACGHITKDADAEVLLTEIHEFLCKVERGEVESTERRPFRGEEEVLYERADGKVSFAGPRKKFDQFMRKVD